MSMLSVMLVDDDSFIREVVGAALAAKPGIAVQSYGKAEDALAAAQAAVPDMIVLDYTMPGADGLAIYHGLKAMIPQMPPVVFLTGRADADLVARLRGAGAAAVLSKPFDPATIATEILKFAESPRTAPPRDNRLDAVAANFRASLPGTMAEITKEWDSLRREWQRSVAESLVMRVHKLAGAGGLFKMHEFGNAARAVEVAMVTQLEAEARGEAVTLVDIEPVVAKLWASAIEAMGKG